MKNTPERKRNTRIQEFGARKTEGWVDFQTISFSGMSRSGNHGILNWIIDSFDSILFFNNMVRETLLSFDYPQIIDERKPETILLSLEFEDIYMALNNYYISSSETLKVILIRDPFNLYASKRKSDKYVFPYKKNKVHAYIRNWKQYAREYLGLTNYFGDKICISYNKWVVDEGYRRGILKALGAVRLDTPHDRMMPCLQTREEKCMGRRCVIPSSSFDGMKFKDNATKMDLFKRWKYYEGSWGFQQILEDEELMYLSEQIFGDIV